MTRHLRSVPDPSGEDIPLDPDGIPVPHPPLHPRRERPVVYRLHVSLQDIEPRIWRRIEVSSDLTLAELHDAVQLSMGWEDAHLHMFSREGSPYAAPPGDTFVMDDTGPFTNEIPGIPESTVRLDEVFSTPGEKLTYLYDFGDDWTHDIRLEQILPDAPDVVGPVRLLDGARACPPEDCGGIWGYALLRDTAQALAAGRKEDLDQNAVDVVAHIYGDMRPEDVLQAFESFDAAAVQAHLELAASAAEQIPDVLLDRLAAVPAPEPVLALAAAVAVAEPPPDPDPADAARAVEPYAWFTRHVGAEGIPLTAAGYLKPADVSAVAERLDLGREWIGKMNREDRTPPVADFRESAVRLGLVRKHKGRLIATKRGLELASRPADLWTHIADLLPLGRGEAERDAGLILLLSTAAGQHLNSPSIWEGPGTGDALLPGDADVDLAGDAFSALGWQLGDGSTPTSRHVYGFARPTTTVLVRTGALDRTAVTGLGRRLARDALGWPHP